MEVLYKGGDVIAHCFDCVRGWRGVRWAVFGGDVKYKTTDKHGMSVISKMLSHIQQCDHALFVLWES